MFLGPRKIMLLEHKKYEPLPNRSVSQSVFRGSQGIRDQFPEDPWIHFCNGYFEVYLFFNFVKTNRGTSLIGGVFISCDR
jgi:hypothetical protein